jgi:hypothetical protein
VVADAKGILRERFGDDAETEGYKKGGAVAVARFEIDGDGEEVRALRRFCQRESSELLMRLLNAIEAR